MTFAVEIISCGNGFIVLEGNSLATSQPYFQERKKWVAKNSDELAELIRMLSSVGLQWKKADE